MSALSAVSLGILSCFVNISRTQLKVAGKSAFPWVEKSLRIPALPSSSRCLSPWPEETAGCHGRWQARGHGPNVPPRRGTPARGGPSGRYRQVGHWVPLSADAAPCLGPKPVRAQGNSPAVVSPAATLSSGLGVAGTLSPGLPSLSRGR